MHANVHNVHVHLHMYHVTTYLCHNIILVIGNLHTPVTYPSGNFDDPLFDSLLQNVPIYKGIMTELITIAQVLQTPSDRF